MKLIITANLNGEAFTDDETGENLDRFKASTTLSRTLPWVAINIGQGDTDGTLMDPNGNTFGTWEVAE